MFVLLFRLRLFALLLNFFVSGRRHLRNPLGLRQALAAALLFTAVFLFGHLALMLVKLKFIYLALGANLGRVEVSHLFSAHIVHVLPFVIRLLDTANCAFV
jgi:hypothetical protein